MEQNHDTVKTRIGLFIPLPEEFAVIKEVFELHMVTAGLVQSWEVKSIKKTNEPLKDAEVIVFRPDGMGNLAAYERTIDFLSVHKVAIVVAIGIGGALDGDLRLGDVAVATNVADIIDASKVRNAAGESGVNANYRLKLNQRPVIPDVMLQREFANHCDIGSPGTVDDWRAESARFAHDRDGSFDLNPKGDFYKSMLHPKTERTPIQVGASHWFGLKHWPHVVAGQFASGVVLGADGLDLSESNREFKVIETEGFGVGRACSRLGIPFTVLRGISDFAGGEKEDNAFRSIAAFNAMSYFAAVLTSGRFRTIHESTLPHGYDISSKHRLLLETGRTVFQPDEEPLVYGLLSLLIRTAHCDEPTQQSEEEARNPRDLYVGSIDLSTAFCVLREIGPKGRSRINNVYILKRKIVNSQLAERFEQNLGAIKELFGDSSKVSVRVETPERALPIHCIMYGDFLHFGIFSLDLAHRYQADKSQHYLAPSEIVNLRIRGQYRWLEQYICDLLRGAVDTERQNGKGVGKAKRKK